ncbi:hypothetical protein Tco_0830424 [Tanacetum coccineum]
MVPPLQRRLSADQRVFSYQRLHLHSRITPSWCNNQKLFHHSEVEVVPPLRRKLRANKRVFSYQRLHPHSEAGSASPPNALPICDLVIWKPIRAKGHVGIPGLLLRSQLAKVAQPDHQWYQVHHGEHISRSYPFRMEPLSPLPKGSDASGGGRTTPKKEARSSHSFHQKDGSTRIVLDERITEHAHEVRAIGCDSKLPLGKNYGVRVGVYQRVTSYNFSESDTYNYLLDPTPDRVIHKLVLRKLEHLLRPRADSKTRALWELSCLLEAARQSLACIRLCLVCPSCLLEAACKSLACIRLCPRGQSCLHAPSTGCGPDVCDIRTSYVRRQCTSSDGDSAAPCLLRGLATPDWLLLAS